MITTCWFIHEDIVHRCTLNLAFTLCSWMICFIPSNVQGGKSNLFQANGSALMLQCSNRLWKPSPLTGHFIALSSHLNCQTWISTRLSFPTNSTPKLLYLLHLYCLGNIAWSSVLSAHCSDFLSLTSPGILHICSVCQQPSWSLNGYTNWLFSLHIEFI